jgi:hypothetical protein
VSSWAESPAVSCSRTPRPSSERTARKPSRSAEGEGIASRDGPLPLRPLRPLRCHLREPPFHVAIELRGFNDWIVHPNIGSGAEATEPSCHRPPQCSWWLPTQACAPSSTLRWIHAAWRVRTHTHLCASSAAVDGFLDGRSVPAWRHMRTFVPNRGGQAAGGHYELAVLPVVACSPVVRHPPPAPRPRNRPAPPVVTSAEKRSLLRRSWIRIRDARTHARTHARVVCALCPGPGMRWW